MMGRSEPARILILTITRGSAMSETPIYTKFQLPRPSPPSPEQTKTTKHMHECFLTDSFY